MPGAAEPSDAADERRVPAADGGGHWHWCVSCQRAVPHRDPRCHGASSPDDAQRAALGAGLDVGSPRLCAACRRLAWKSRVDGFVLGVLLGLILGVVLVGVWR